MDPPHLQILPEKLVQGFLLGGSQGIDLAVARDEVRGKVNGMIPGSTGWQLIEGFFTEDVRKIGNVLCGVFGRCLRRLGAESSDPFHSQGSIFAMEISLAIHFKDVISISKQCVVNNVIHVSRGHDVALEGTSIKFDRTLNPIQGRIGLLQPLMTQVNGKIVKVMDQEEDVFAMSLDG